MKTLDLAGTVVQIQALRDAKQRSLATLADEGRLAFTRLVECRHVGDLDVVVVDVDVELGQVLKNPILPVERLALVFYPHDLDGPEALALRPDFPLVPHVNVRPWEFPRSLCLFDEPYRDLKRRWTPPLFVERIRDWLRLTARGELHEQISRSSRS